MERNTNICLIGYKTGETELGFTYGQKFSELVTCCDKFSLWFVSTGNKKSTNFGVNGAPFDDENGFNLVTRGNEMQMELQRDATRSQMHFCSFCGAKIQIKETSRVLLKEKKKSVSDGFEEQKIE